MKKLIFLVAFAILFASCEPSLEEYMTDSWQTSYIKIEMPTYQNRDSTNVFEDTFENNPPRIAQSQYNADGTFTAWYLTPTGVRLGDTPGTWDVEKDSLHIAFPSKGDTIRVSYKVKRTEEGFEAISKYDWDEDGKKDDLLLMRTKRIVLEEENKQ
jgi:hypothetical protein